MDWSTTWRERVSHIPILAARVIDCLRAIMTDAQSDKGNGDELEEGACKEVHAFLEHAPGVADADAPEAWGADGGHRRIADEVFAIEQVFEDGLQGDGGADLMSNG
jgi:hypothetical protein